MSLRTAPQPVELDAHPDGQHVLHRVGSGTPERPYLTTVTDRRTGRVVREDPGIIAACWRARGSELLTINPERDASFVLHRHSWPAQDRLDSIALPTLFGEPTRIVPAPEAPWVAIAWQRELAGWDIVDLENRVHRREATYFNRSGLEGPYFSPDGRRIVGVQVSADIRAMPSLLSGQAILGSLVVALCDTFDYLESDIPVTERAIVCQLIYQHAPVFLDPTRFRLELPTVETRLFDITSPTGVSFHRELRTRREAEAAVIRERNARLEAISDHNRRAREISRRVRSQCPRCGHPTLRFHAGSPEDRAIFDCALCCRSFALEDFGPGSPGAQRLRG